MEYLKKCNLDELLKTEYEGSGAEGSEQLEWVIHSLYGLVRDRCPELPAKIYIHTEHKSGNRYLSQVMIEYNDNRVKDVIDDFIFRVRQTVK